MSKEQERLKERKQALEARIAELEKAVGAHQETLASLRKELEALQRATGGKKS